MYLVHEQPLVRHAGGQGSSPARSHLQLVQQHRRAAIVWWRPPGQLQRPTSTCIAAGLQDSRPAHVGRIAQAA